MYKIVLIFALSVVFYPGSIKAQTITATDSTTLKRAPKTEMYYDIGNGKTLVYGKPKKWTFITNLPKDAGGIVSTTFSKEAVKPLLVVAGTTGALLLSDQAIADGVQQFSRNIHLDPAEDNKNVMMKLGGKDVAILRFPGNVNTALYQIGQGFPSLVIGAGLFTYGKIKNDYRALSTSSQLAESFILMGVGTQIVKRITGRQSPSEANTPGGNWHFFPSFSEFQQHTPNYDAFPSGHLATLMSTITIFAENYPEKRWIRPVGYSISALVCFSMINNEVHWASDYPLALAMGYLCAKQVVKRSRQVVNSSTCKKKHGELDFSCNYLNRTLMPGIVYKF
jgi:membrane-associated phospholipid phosphatase